MFGCEDYQWFVSVIFRCCAEKGLKGQEDLSIFRKSFGVFNFPVKLSRFICFL